MRLAWVIGGVVSLIGMGCAVGPMLTEGIVQTPEAVVESVRVVDQTDDGLRLEAVVRIRNPNEVGLAAQRGSVWFELEGLRPYEARMEPTIALPPSGERLWRVPVAVAKPSPGWSAGGRSYKMEVELRFVPPGELREILTESGVPLPWLSATARGRLP